MGTQVRRLVVAVVVVLAGGGVVAAADPVAVITIPDMDCSGCAKKLGTNLTTVAGVAKVEYDVPGRTIRVTAKPQAAPSPKAMWEAVEKGGKVPAKLIGVDGTTFTAKPKN